MDNVGLYLNLTDASDILANYLAWGVVTDHAVRYCIHMVSHKISYVRWSSGMSRLSGLLILRYIQLWYENPFVSYCFQLDKIVYIFGIISPILMGFSAKQSSRSAFTTELKKLKFDSARLKTHFAWLHHVWYMNLSKMNKSNCTNIIQESIISVFQSSLTGRSASLTFSSSKKVVHVLTIMNGGWYQC